MKKIKFLSLTMKRRGVLLPIVVFLILGIAAVFPLLVSMSETTQNRTQYSEEWARIQWAIEGANQRQLESTSTVVDPYSGVVTTIATFTYPESGGSFDVAVSISEGRTLLGRHRTLTATAKAYRNGVDAGYDLSGLSAATVSVPGVAAGGEHSFAWKKDGTLYSWGRNNYGQLGLADSSDRSTPAQTQNGACPSSALPYYTQGWMVAGGGSHTVALDYFGRVYSWGRNNRGQLGHSGTTNVNVPQTVMLGVNNQLQNVSDLAAGDEFSLALTNSGNVYYWGRVFEHSRPGFLGIPVVTFMESNFPVFLQAVSGSGSLPNIVGVAAGKNHGLAMDTGGNVFSWGLNSFDQLGAGFSDDYSIRPIKANDTIATWVAQVPAYGNNLRRNSDPTTQFNIPVGYFVGSFSVEMNRTFNTNVSGVLYNYDVIRLSHTNGNTTDIIPNVTVESIGSGRFRWSYDSNYPGNAYSLVNPGTYTVRVFNLRGVKIFGFIIPLEDELNLNVWYRNSDSSDTTSLNKGVFSFFGRPIEEPTDFFGIAAGGDFSMAVRRDGTATRLYTWGRNNQGQLGYGDTTQRNRMAPIPNFPPTGEKIRTIAAGREHALALTESGKVYSWGNNTNGQLGRTVNTTNPKERPALVTSTIGGIKITGIVAGAFHSLAIDEEGRVYGWGLQSNGRVGNGSTSNTGVSTPVQLTGFP